MTESEAYVQFAIPGVPYSAVRIPLSLNPEEQQIVTENALAAAQAFADAFALTFAEPFQAAPEPRQQLPRQQAAPRPTQTQRAPQGRPAARQTSPSADLDPELVVYGNCPDHPRVSALPSILRYQEVEMDDEGNERYAKYYCDGKANGTGKNHSLYARQLI